MKYLPAKILLILTAHSLAQAAPGYYQGRTHPNAGDQLLDASAYGIIADDGQDDTQALQALLDYAATLSSPKHRVEIVLPAGEVLLSNEINIDGSHLIITGRGADPSQSRHTLIHFRPTTAQAYKINNDNIDKPEPNIDGSDWPGKAIFHVESRQAFSALQPPRSINWHWLSGFQVDEQQPGVIGSRDIRFTPSRNGEPPINVGATVLVGATNTVDFYRFMGLTDRSHYKRQHLRSQMFTVSAINGSRLTLDQPLEFDVPYSDQNQLVAAKKDPYYSKVMHVTAVQDVGFRNLWIKTSLDRTEYAQLNTRAYHPATNTQGVGYYLHSPALQYAYHGILFKFVTNAWIDNVRIEMAGSHALVTEFARHCTFENSVFQGAWNKGDGQGYVRLSKLYDSLFQNNRLIDLRHLSLQWSASGNVIRNNEIEADLNLHGGWERNNLLVDNKISIPYELYDKSGQRTSKFPLWWSPGAKATWAGASGPNNVLCNNHFLQQTPTGLYQPSGHYDTPNLSYHLAWDGQTWQHLSQQGNMIQDWSQATALENYTQYPNAGVITTADCPENPPGRTAAANVLATCARADAQFTLSLPCVNAEGHYYQAQLQQTSANPSLDTLRWQVMPDIGEQAIEDNRYCSLLTTNSDVIMPCLLFDEQPYQVGLKAANDEPFTWTLETLVTHSGMKIK